MFTLSCCKDDDKPAPPTAPPTETYPDSLAGVLNIGFNHVMGNQPLILETKQYTNAAQDSFTISNLRYYISNVKLLNTQTGEVFKEPRSYHLIEAKGGKTSFKI